MVVEKMLQSKLLELLNKGEGSKLEYKRDDVHPKVVAKEIVAFANMNGGQILMGVEDDGMVSGIQRENFQEWLIDTVIAQYVDPFILPDYEEVAHEGKTIAVITVHQGTNKPYVLKLNNREDVYVRYGNTCQLASREQQARLFESGGFLFTEKLPVHGSTIADLDERRYREYFHTILEYPVDEDLQTLLTDHNILIDDVCSYFGYALFAKTPQLRLPQSGLRLTVYKGEDKEYNATLDKNLNIPFLAYLGQNRPSDPIESALHENSRIQEYISRETVDNMTRKRVWDYPPKVIRELIINALVHRDWTKRDCVRVVVYANRCEIISPGALPNGMTVEKMKSGVSVQRNPLSVRIFRDYGYMEQQGIGIRRTVIPMMKKHNGTQPGFEATEDYLKVTLRKV